CDIGIPTFEYGYTAVTSLHRRRAHGTRHARCRCAPRVRGRLDRDPAWRGLRWRASSAPCRARSALAARGAPAHETPQRRSGLRPLRRGDRAVARANAVEHRVELGSRRDPGVASSARRPLLELVTRRGPSADQHLAATTRRLQALAEVPRVRGRAPRESADAERVGVLGLDSFDDLA